MEATEATAQQLAELAQGHRKRGDLFCEAGELDDAIEAYEQALEAEPDLDATRGLADLFAKRARPGDAEQAADLYYAVGDVLGDPEGLPILELALDQVPSHGEALSLLENLIPREQQAERLSARWAAFVAASSDKQAVAARRQLLMRAQAEARGGPAAQSGRTVVVYRVPVEEEKRRELATHDGKRIPAMAEVEAAAPAPVSSVAPTHPVAAARSVAPRLVAPAVAAASEHLSWPAARIPPSRPPSAPHVSSVAPSAAALRSSAPLPRVSARSSAAPAPASTPIAAVPTSAPAPTPAPRSVPPSAVELEVDPVELPKPRFALPDKRWLIGGAVASAVLVSVIVFRSSSSAPPSVAAGSSASSAAVSGSTATSTPVAAPAPVPAAAVAPIAPVAPAAATTEVAAAKVEPSPSDVKKTAAHAGPHVHASLELASVAGGKLSDEQLASVLDKVDGKLEHCYAQTLKKKPHTQGRMTLAFTVRPNGRVAGVHKVTSTIKDPALYRCTAQVIATARFPKPPKKAATVKVPLDFKQ